ncbi:DNA primase [Alsobacter metallidurans]|uniref:DNA primase n=1 Tax=Alsobacter metallidurans TaxID=340221 RepID=A0A917MJQ0_9HYPH|nr:DNA primase [Alsobacter metallidurans]GGH28187.1 DNA primase [Alsobacter metallidurans]
MKFPPGLLDEIRARLPVSEVVGKRVRLQKAGREWKGLSPFNAERSPSFFVNDQKGFFHDFSSGKHGDIFAFVMETEGVAFPEAVERLAGQAGVALPKISREAEEQERKVRGLNEVMQLAADFYRSQLEGRVGAKARAYCENRGLGPDVRERFGLGYSSAERHGLRDHLAGKGVSVGAMIETGLLVHGDDVAVPFDRFRDRLMFPIWDIRGRAIAFGGRALQADVPAKYLNSPETSLFHKGAVLYNHHNARKAAHERGTVIAVEGYVDVIAMSVAGFPHAVAPLGTALTPDQLTLLWRMTDEPILCFDGDKAGQRAAYRAIEVALPLLEPGKSLRFALLPEGQDPDDLARSGGGPAIARVLEGALPMAEVLWRRETEAGPLDTPERKAMLERRIRTLLAGVRDEDLRRHYRAEMDARMRELTPRGGGYGAGRPGGAYGGARPGAGAPARGGQRRGDPRRGGFGSEPMRASESLARSPLFSQAPTVSPREALILLALAAHRMLLATQAEALGELDLAHPDTNRLRQALVDIDAHLERGSATDVRAALEAQGLGPLLARLEAAVRPGDRWCLDSSADPDEVRESLRQATTLHHKARTLHKELGLAEMAFAQDESEASLAWIRDLRLQLSTIDGMEAEIEKLGRGDDPLAAND